MASRVQRHLHEVGMLPVGGRGGSEVCARELFAEDGLPDRAFLHGSPEAMAGHAEGSQIPGLQQAHDG